MLNGKSGLGHNALLRTKGWRYPLRLPIYRPHPRFRETTVLRKPVGEGASLRLDAGRRMEQREKRSQASSVSTEGQITGGGRLRQEALEEGSLVPSDVPDGLTNINGSEIAAQFENSEDYRHL